MEITSISAAPDQVIIRYVVDGDSSERQKIVSPIDAMRRAQAAIDMSKDFVLAPQLRSEYLDMAEEFICKADEAKKLAGKPAYSDRYPSVKALVNHVHSQRVALANKRNAAKARR